MNQFVVLRACRSRRAIMLTVGMAIMLGGGTLATAAMFFGDEVNGSALSATAEFTSVGDVLAVKLTNSSMTRTADDLLTGIDFSLNGLTPTLSSVSAILRKIHRDGTFFDSSDPHELSWSLEPVSDDTWRLSFHPDARHAIVGPPTGGSYGDANHSVRGNRGHNPYAAEMAVAEIDVPGLQEMTMPMVAVTAFHFSGDVQEAEGRIVPGGPLETPEPATSALTMFAVTALVWLWRRRQSSFVDQAPTM